MLCFHVLALSGSKMVGYLNAGEIKKSPAFVTMVEIINKVISNARFMDFPFLIFYNSTTSIFQLGRMVLRCSFISDFKIISISSISLSPDLFSKI